VPGSEPVTDFTASVIDEFRANGGRVGGPLEGVPLVLITHRGARSGRHRTTPLGCYADGEELVVFASNLGAPRHPAWFHNIVANPRVTVERGHERYEADAVALSGGERASVWQRLAQARPFLVEHQARAGSREIPLITLRRQSPSDFVGTGPD
jgi:deazaflavin-dependent oxidoreductase (nitroreductase family)